MKKATKNSYNWDELRVGITGASGTLGIALIKELKSKGAFVIGLTSTKVEIKNESKTSPDEWINWTCGEEYLLAEILNNIDIIILNHGINTQGNQSYDDINTSLEVNALSVWRFMELFERVSKKRDKEGKNKEIWVNTSEAEIQPALSPSYEISKRLAGQLVSIKRTSLFSNSNSCLKIRKLILGPFKSELNPIGIMNAGNVAKEIIKLAELNRNIIIVSPNPITYILIPINELLRVFYYRLTSTLNNSKEK